MSTLVEQLEKIVGDGAVVEWTPGLPEVPMACPKDRDEARELVRFAGRKRLSVIPMGLGTKLSWTAPPERVDFMISTRRIAGVTSHEPGDGTITALAGTTIFELRRTARLGGHWFTPSVPHSSSATLGGVLSAGQSGTDRLRFGPSRDHLLGAEVLLASGRCAKSGGRLVKNVTGYDLHRLYWGSHGTVCLLLEASMRLFPEPESQVVIGARWSSSREALERARSVLDCGARCVSVTVAETRPGEWNLLAHLSGRQESLEWESSRVTDALGTKEASVERTPEGIRAIRDRELPGGQWPHLHLTCLPSRVDAVLASLERAAGELGLRVQPFIHPGIATIDVVLETREGEDPDEAEAVGELVLALRTELSPLGADVRLRCASAAVRARVNPIGDEPPGFSLMKGLRDSLDERGVFARGRFVGGL